MKIQIARLCLCLLATFSFPWAVNGEGFFGLKASSPLLVSGSGGFYLGGAVDPGVTELRPAVEAEIGLGGGRILAGMDTIGTGFGYGIKAAILRTWFEPIGADEDNTYLGVELEGAYDRMILSVGGYRRIEGDDDGWIAAVSIGFRL